MAIITYGNLQEEIFRLAEETIPSPNQSEQVFLKIIARQLGRVMSTVGPKGTTLEQAASLVVKSQDVFMLLASLNAKLEEYAIDRAAADLLDREYPESRPFYEQIGTTYAHSLDTDLRNKILQKIKESLPPESPLILVCDELIADTHTLGEALVKFLDDHHSPELGCETPSENCDHFANKYRELLNSLFSEPGQSEVTDRPWSKQSGHVH